MSINSATSSYQSYATQNGIIPEHAGTLPGPGPPAHRTSRRALARPRSGKSRLQSSCWAFIGRVRASVASNLICEQCVLGTVSDLDSTVTSGSRQSDRPAPCGRRMQRPGQVKDCACDLRRGRPPPSDPDACARRRSCRVTYPQSTGSSVHVTGGRCRSDGPCQCRGSAHGGRENNRDRSRFARKLACTLAQR